MPIVLPHDGVLPVFGRDVFVADNATIVGRVVLGDGTSVWFGAVLRGDVGRIEVGARSNLQDLVCVHMTGGVSDVRVGEDVTVGHAAILHGCTVEDRCLVGMGAIVMDNAVVGAGSVVAAGALVPARMIVPPGSLVLGRPAKVVRPVTDAEARLGPDGARHYIELCAKYRQPPPTK